MDLMIKTQIVNAFNYSKCQLTLSIKNKDTNVIIRRNSIETKKIAIIHFSINFHQSSKTTNHASIKSISTLVFNRNPLNSISFYLYEKFGVQYYVNLMKNYQTEIAHRMHMHVGLFANQRYHCETRYFI